MATKTEARANLKSRKLAPIVPKPDAPENKFLSKAEYVRRNEERKKREAAGSAYVKSLEAEDKAKAAERKAIAKAEAEAKAEAAKKPKEKATRKKKKEE